MSFLRQRKGQILKFFFKSIPTQIADAALSSDSGNQAAETIPGITNKKTLPIASKVCPVNDKARKWIKHF